MKTFEWNKHARIAIANAATIGAKPVLFVFKEGGEFVPWTASALTDQHVHAIRFSNETRWDECHGWYVGECRGKFGPGSVDPKQRYNHAKWKPVWQIISDHLAHFTSTDESGWKSYWAEIQQWANDMKPWFTQMNAFGPPPAPSNMFYAPQGFEDDICFITHMLEAFARGEHFLVAKLSYLGGEA